jgi:hypothetical protein
MSRANDTRTLTSLSAFSQPGAIAVPPSSVGFSKPTSGA